MFNVLSDAMKIRRTVKLDRLQRMDEWQLCGCSISRALGIPQERFLDCYHADIARQHQETVDSDPVCLAVRELMAPRLRWQGTPTKLFSELATIAKTERLDKEACWPKAPNALTRRINELKENLAATGVAVSQPRTKTQRTVMLNRIEPFSRDGTPSPSSPKQVTASNQRFLGDDGDDGYLVSTA